MEHGECSGAIFKVDGQVRCLVVFKFIFRDLKNVFGLLI